MRGLTVMGLVLSLACPAAAAWDDIAGFMGALRRHAPEAAQHTQLSIESLPAKAGLALLSSQVESPRDLRALVQGGGRLLLVAEADLDPAVLATFALRPAPAPEGPRLGDHPALIEVPSTRSGLLASLPPIVTNRPVGLASTADLEPTARYADGTAFAFSLRLGAGEVIVLGDSSVLLDLMRPVGGNARLADRLAQWLSADGRPVHVVTTALTGTRPDPRPAQAKNRLNRWLEGRSAHAPDRLTLAALAALLSVGLVVLALFVFPGRGRRRPPAGAADDDRIAGLAARPGGPADPRSPDLGDPS